MATSVQIAHPIPVGGIVRVPGDVVSVDDVEARRLVVAGYAIYYATGGTQPPPPPTEEDHLAAYVRGDGPLPDALMDRFAYLDEGGVLVIGRDYVKQPVGGEGGGGGSAVWPVAGTPSTFPPEAHQHVLGDVTGLTAALAAKADGTAAALRDRSTHTGTQTSASISDFAEAAQDAVAAALRGVTGATVTYDDSANTITITGVGDPETMRDTIGTALVGLGNITVAVNDTADTITISTTATANSTDAALRDRSTHTGSQTASTISNFNAAAAAAALAAATQNNVNDTLVRRDEYGGIKVGDIETWTTRINNPTQVDAPSAATRKDYVDTGDAARVPLSLVDAKGDLLIGTANDTIVRLPIGTEGQSPVVRSGTLVYEALSGGGGGGGYRAATFCEATASGSGQTIPAAFTTMNLNAARIDPAGNFNPSTSIYTAPQSGLYLIIAFWRVPDGAPANISHGLGVHDSNSDGTWFQWANSIAGRKSRNYQRVVDLVSGAQMRMFAYSEGNLAVEFASMQIVRIG